MNRYDWMKVLTRGCPPHKLKKDEKGAVKIQAVPPTEENEIPDDAEFSIDGAEEESSGVKKKTKAKSKEKMAQIMKEEINHFRNSKNIHIYGTDIAPPIRTFEQLSEEYNVNRRIVDNLLKENYKEPTPIQMQAWPLLLKRREVLGCAPTGSGKTAAFILPIIHQLKSPRAKGFRALILAPTRELAKQIVRESDRLAEGSGLKTSIIGKGNATISSSYFKKFDILVTTPNKLIFLLKEDEVIQNILAKVEWLIVDESDKLFEEGKRGFRDQLATLVRACSGPNVVRGLFSATLSYDVEEWCKLNLNNLAIVSIGTRNTCPDVEQSLSFCASNAGKIMEIHNILRKGYEIPCLIFVQTKERATKLCEEILLTDRPVRCIHSDMSQAKRDEIVKEFRQKKIWILICTELMGRGIDFKGVNLVINYDFPPSIVSYIHRIGRTGRAGKKGKAITFWSMEDRPLLRSIGHVMKNSGSEVPEWILNLKSNSTLARKKYRKNMPARGGILEGMKEKERKQKTFKRKLNNDEEGKQNKTDDKENIKKIKKQKSFPTEEIKSINSKKEKRKRKLKEKTKNKNEKT